MCPECGSDNITIEPYAYGVSRETGYRNVVSSQCTGEAKTVPSRFCGIG